MRTNLPSLYLQPLQYTPEDEDRDGSRNIGFFAF
jgi:hypothetical protein